MSMKSIVSALGLLLILSSCGGEIARDAKGREDFNKFHEKFYKDEAFQLSRIDFPLLGPKQSDGRHIYFEESSWTTLKTVDMSKGNVKRQIVELSDELIQERYAFYNSFAIELNYNLNPETKNWYLSYYSGIDAGNVEAQVDSNAVNGNNKNTQLIEVDSN